METKVSIYKHDIKDGIYIIRGKHVMLDEDLAILYHVKTKALNQAANRNIERFPTQFRFQITKEEFFNLKSQSVTSSWGGRRNNPYVFTEQGIAMLSSVLKSKTAINISIQIMDAFIAMRKFIASNANVFNRLEVVEKKQIEHEIKFENVFEAISSKGILPQKGIFFNGQMFDAYRFVSDLIRSADKSIILIDNYVDDSVLAIMDKRKEGVKVEIYTKEISKTLALDVSKHNSQYPSVFVKEFKLSHDRFLIIDNTVYSIGSSLKDIGKKWFAFCRFERDSLDILKRIEESS